MEADRPAGAGRGSLRLRLRWDRIGLLLGTLVLGAATLVHALAGGGRSSAATVVRPARTAARPPAAGCHPSREPIRAAPPAPAAPGDRTVALTFDDGPGAWTPKVLDVLARERVPATFFVIGRQVAANAAVLRREATGGNVIGNHTWSHPEVPAAVGWNAGRLSTEIARTDQAVRRVTGSATCLFRPPGGVARGAGPVAARWRMSMVLWSVDTRDWQLDRADPAGAATAAASIAAAAEAGLAQRHPVVLLHDGGGNRGATVAALPSIIQVYRGRGYRFVTLGS